MDKLRVDSGIKKIEVNDNGDFIIIPVSDASFFERFGIVMKNFEQKELEYNQKAKELFEKHKDKPDDDVDMIVDGISLYSSLCKDTCEEIDKLFGDGCCKNVFVGIQNPSIELIGDFFEKITPLLNQYAKERNQRIDLIYSRNRKGARSKGVRK